MYTELTGVQLRATLQTALNTPELTDLAFVAWVTMVSHAGEEDVEYLIDHTFAIIVQHWSMFAMETHTIAHDTVAELLKLHNPLICERIEMIPSLTGIPLLQKFDADICRLKKGRDISQRLEAFARRCQDESATVVRQGLQELISFLSEYQKMIHESALSQQPASGINQLYRALLDVAIRFRDLESDILEYCARCLGVLGSMDPNMVELTRAKQEILMLSNFEVAAEVIDFVASMLENVLVKAFRSAESGTRQIYLAYVMQQLLRFCGFAEALSLRSKAAQSSAAHQRWIKIPESIRSILAPYFHTKYIVTSPAGPGDDTALPIFQPKLNNSTWLRTLVYSLLNKGKGENAQMVFRELSRVIWNHDIAIATFILPFAMLNVIVGGTDSESSGIKQEILAVLSCDLSMLSQAEADNVKQCSEVCKTICTRARRH